MNFFATCLALLNRQQGGSDHEPASEQLAPMANFLVELGYLQQSNDTGALRSTKVDSVTEENRRSLLKIAARFERCFRLPMRHAPGAAFFGGQFAPSAFGLARHGSAVHSAAGKGVTLRQAFESCIGEAAEHLSILQPSNTQPAWQAQAEHHLPFVADETLRWSLGGIGLTAETHPHTLDWLEATSLVDGTRVAFPVALCLRPPVGSRTLPRVAETNGCAAGKTHKASILRALEEVVERDAVALWWFGGRDGKTLSPALSKALGIDTLMTSIRGGSSRPHWFIDLTGESGIPVVGALSSEADGSSVIAGFSAGLNIAKAMTSAALEMCQMELAQELALLKREQEGDKALNEIDRKWIDRRQRLHIAAFPQLRPSQISQLEAMGPSAAPLSDCVERLAACGFTPYWIDLSRELLGVPVARVLVPGLQSAKPDWLTQRLSAVAARNSRDVAAFAQMPAPM